MVVSAARWVLRRSSSARMYRSRIVASMARPTGPRGDAERVRLTMSVPSGLEIVAVPPARERTALLSPTKWRAIKVTSSEFCLRWQGVMS